MTRFFACLILMLALTVTARAADHFVLNNNDSGPGSLRQSLLDALADPDELSPIRFDTAYPPGATISLLSPLPTLANKTQIMIIGDGRNPRIVAPSGSMDGILRAEQSLSRLSVHGLRLEGGRHNRGGGCIRGEHINPNLPAILHIDDSEFVDCRVESSTSDAASGGAVLWDSPVGEVSIEDSVFRDNGIGSGPNGAEFGSGGAVRVSGEYVSIRRSAFHGNEVRMVRGAGGAVSLGIPLLELSISDSIFSANVVDAEASNGATGGAVSGGCFEDCVATLERNYFGQNSADLGGAVYLRRGNSDPAYITLALVNNTFHENTATTNGGALFLGRAAINLGFNTLEANEAAVGAHLYLLTARAGEITHNLFGTATGLPCYFYTVSIDALEGGSNAFVDDGCSSRMEPAADVLPFVGNYALDLDAPMPVLAYPADSPLTDGGDACVALDARQNTRPLDGDGDGVALCDIGAYERPAAPPMLIFDDGFED